MQQMNANPQGQTKEPQYLFQQQDKTCPKMGSSFQGFFKLFYPLDFGGCHSASGKTAILSPRAYCTAVKPLVHNRAGLCMHVVPQLPRMINPGRQQPCRAEAGGLSHAGHVQWRGSLQVCQDKSGMVWMGILINSLKNWQISLSYEKVTPGNLLHSTHKQEQH